MLPIEAQRLRGPSVVTWLLIIVNVVVFAYVALLEPKMLSYAIEKYGLIPYHVLRGKRLYTLVSSMFVHGNLLHLLGNMIYLYAFGCSVEARLGKARYFVFYMASGIAASLIHIAIEAWFAEPVVIYGPFFEHRAVVDPLLIPCVGASGAISGVLGAYLVLFPRSSVSVLTFVFFWLPMVIRVPAIIFVGFWFLYQLWMGLISLSLGIFSGVAFWAHVGGFIAGLVLAPIAARRGRKRRVYHAGRWWYEIPVE